MNQPFDSRESAPAADPEQLPLGVFAGVPLIPVEMVGPDDEIVIVPMREPPVCGEWSYDDEELEQPRFVARRIVGVAAPTSKATPILAPAAPARTARPTMESLRAAYEQAPGDTQRALTYISALEKRSDTDDALRVIDQAIEAGADAFLLTCARASALGAKLRYDDAEKAIRSAAKMRPDAPEVLLQSGILACRRARWRDAVEPLQKATSLAPDNAIAHYFVGEALNHTDTLPGALAAYERAVEIEPDNWRAMKGIGIILDRLGRPADAALAYRRARDAQTA